MLPFSSKARVLSLICRPDSLLPRLDKGGTAPSRDDTSQMQLRAHQVVKDRYQVRGFAPHHADRGRGQFPSPVSLTSPLRSWCCVRGVENLIGVVCPCQPSPRFFPTR